jgi:hypothetical protein
MSHDLARPPLVDYSIGELETIADYVAKSQMFKVRTKEAAITLMLLCQADGLHPIKALRRYHVLDDGSISMRADAMQAEFQTRGGTVEWIETTAEKAEAVFSHPALQAKPIRLSVTFESLDAAGVTRGRDGVKTNWRKFPRQMLRARLISEAVRMIDPGIVCGIYTPEEASDFGDSPLTEPTDLRGRNGRAPKATAKVIDVTEPAAPQPPTPTAPPSDPPAARPAPAKTWAKVLDDALGYWKKTQPDVTVGAVEVMRRRNKLLVALGRWAREQGHADANEAFERLEQLNRVYRDHADAVRRRIKEIIDGDAEDLAARDLAPNHATVAELPMRVAETEHLPPVNRLKEPAFDEFATANGKAS